MSHKTDPDKDFNPVALFDRRTARRNDRFALLALEAARQAIGDSRLTFDAGLGQSTGVLIGTTLVSPFVALMMMPNAASATIAITHGLRGPNLCVVSACATGSHAVGEAATTAAWPSAAGNRCAFEVWVARSRLSTGATRSFKDNDEQGPRSDWTGAGGDRWVVV